MDTQQRLIQNMDQLTRRVDELAMKVVILENNQEHLDEKMLELKNLIVEKNAEIRTALDQSNVRIQASINTWNRIGFWLLTCLGGVFVIAAGNFIVRGGLSG